MRQVNLIIEDLDINSEDFICDFIERLGFSYTKQELKAPKQKKGKTISNIIDEIQSRYILSGYDVIQTFNIENGFLFLFATLKRVIDVEVLNVIQWINTKNMLDITLLSHALVAGKIWKKNFFLNCKNVARFVRAFLYCYLSMIDK